ACRSFAWPGRARSSTGSSDMTHDRFLITVAAALAALALLFEFTGVSVAAFVMDHFVDEKGYLNRADRTACLSLAARRPAIVTTGDSHAEAAWNLTLAQDLLGTVRIG